MASLAPRHAAPAVNWEDSPVLGRAEGRGDSCLILDKARHSLPLPPTLSPLHRSAGRAFREGGALARPARPLLP